MEMSKIEKNLFNPNVMEPEDFEALKKDVSCNRERFYAVDTDQGRRLTCDQHVTKEAEKG